MEHYDDKLIGWGIDYLAIQCNGVEKERSYAVIHKISCINPHCKTKSNTNTRELSLIENYQLREKIWNNFAKYNNFKNTYLKQRYESIPMSEKNELQDC